MNNSTSNGENTETDIEITEVNETNTAGPAEPGYFIFLSASTK